jgi:type 1 glutamine amidotransferase
VIYTALTHVSLNEADSAEYLKLLATKPIIGGRRSHHSVGLRVAKDGRAQGAAMDAFALEMFGGKYAGHHGGPIRFKEGSADHPVVKGLDGLVKLSLFDRGYKHVIADDVKVLVETHEGQPQVWVREKKGEKPRVFYFVHDPRDIQQHEVVRQMIARALFWATERNEADYKKD